MNALVSPTAVRLLAAFRAANPRSRAVSLVKLIRNGSSVKQYGCVLCGAKGPTYCARFPETKVSREWCLTHVAAHVDAVEANHSESVALDADEEGKHDLAAKIRGQAKCQKGLS